MTSELFFARPDGVPCGLIAESRRAISAETDLDLAVAWLQRRYPDLCIWWGEYTGSIWALLPDQLVEAKNALDLARRIAPPCGAPRPDTSSGRGHSLGHPTAPGPTEVG